TWRVRSVGRSRDGAYFDAAVAGAARLGRVVCDGARVAEPFRDEAPGFNAPADQRGAHGFGAAEAERGVGAVAADIVGVTLDAQRAGTRLRRSRDAVEQAIAGDADHRAVAGELDRGRAEQAGHRVIATLFGDSR